jgi:hypothetical protein
MKRLALMMTLLLPGSAAFAQEMDPRPKPEAPAARAEAEKAPATKQLTANVLATDPVAKTITFKAEGAASAQEMTLPVEAKALASLKVVSPGEKVKVTFRTDAAGKETAVTAIEKSAADKDKPKADAPKSPDHP